LCVAVFGLFFSFAGVHSLPLIDAFLGFGIGLLMFLPFYALGMMGAGDVKLFAASATFLGPTVALLASVATLGLGAIITIAIVLYRFTHIHALNTHPGSDETSWWQTRIPYAPSISIGVGSIALYQSLVGPI
jgi:Flp pilus assembly protein protease CpaA